MQNYQMCLQNFKNEHSKIINQNTNIQPVTEKQTATDGYEKTEEEGQRREVSKIQFVILSMSICMTQLQLDIHLYRCIKFKQSIGKLNSKLFNINNMVKIQISQPQTLNSGRKFKRVPSSESVSTLQEFQKNTVPRIIPIEIKTQFIQLITKRNYSMKQAAKMVEMSYSTAKKIYGRFRRGNLEKHSPKHSDEASRAGYLTITESPVKPIPIVCLIAGNPQNC